MANNYVTLGGGSWDADLARYTNKFISKLSRYFYKENLDRRPIRSSLAPGKYNNDAYVQDVLYKLGMYKDRLGKNNLTYEQAVDGKYGKRTRAAIENAISQGYIVDRSKGTVSRYVPKHWYPGDSKNEGLKALFDHKRKYGVTDPYAVVDKKNGFITIYKDFNKPVYRAPINLGRVKGDYMHPFDVSHYPELSRTTGAGVYTVIGHPTSIKRYGGGPRYTLVTEAGPQKDNTEWHEPITDRSRRIPFINPNANNRVTYSCINTEPGSVAEVYNKKLLNSGDSLYVLPEIEGNALVERQGRMQMHWGKNNPTHYVDKRGVRRKAHYNNTK